VKENMAFSNKPLTDSKLPALIAHTYQNYVAAAQKSGLALSEVHTRATQLKDLVLQNATYPYKFDIFHQGIRAPFDYYQFGLNFITPLIDLERSQVLNLSQVQQIEAQLARGENVILLANHQTEADPQIINLLLKGQAFASEMIFVAGHRVIEDPMAIPLSMGCNLLCIYSKKHIDHPPTDKANKILHNQRTLNKMSELLSEGGKCIYVAPSGGRDRPNPHGFIDVAPFDPSSIELFWLIAQQAEKMSHFYPLALLTHDVLPPPRHVEKELGETRLFNYTPAYLAFGPEVDMSTISNSTHELSKKEKRQRRADFIWNQVHKDYLKMVKLKNSI
jgi:glycerol-3-phosphate O-acyltransferase